MKENAVHVGRNLNRIMRILDVKQETLARELGEDWNQQKVSLLIQKEEIDSKILDQVAKILKVPVAAIKNFDENASISIVANTFHDFKDNSVASAMNYQCSFHPIDKIVELFERQLKEKNKEIQRLIKAKKNTRK